MAGSEYFISGIDTYCGKTYITGLLAYHLKKAGKKVITSKLIQTGCKGISEDILEHRRLMHSEVLPEDKSGITCPFVYTYPASPHLAIEIDNKPIDFSLIRSGIEKLKKNYEVILSEGAGGLMVPFQKNYFTIDYIKKNNLPLILVGSSKLGSINHTLLSIQLCINFGINIHAFVYNQMPGHDEIIASGSLKFITSYLNQNLPETKIIIGKELNNNSSPYIVRFF